MTPPSTLGIGCVGCLWRAIILGLALVGFLRLAAMFLPPLLDAIVGPFLVTETIRTVRSPDKSTTARIYVTRGGLGTVWTTRVRVVPQGQEGWLIYQTKDSDYVPTLHWADRDTLLIGVGCERFDHLSNPDDWEGVSEARRSFKVRILYVDPRCAPRFVGKLLPHNERLRYAP